MPSSLVSPGAPKYKPPPFGGGGGGLSGLPIFPGGASGGSVPGMNIGPGFPQPGVPGTGGGFGAPGGGSGMSGTGGGFGAAPPLNNNVDPSQNLKWLEDQYKTRLGADPTKRAIAGATSGIRDATTGLAKELGGNMARRGIAQSGIRTSGEQGLAQNAQQQIAGAASGITQARERDVDAMVMGGLPIMGAQDELGLRKQGLGLQQWQAQNQAEIARQQLGLQAQSQAQQGQQAMMSMWSQYLNMFR